MPEEKEDNKETDNEPASFEFEEESGSSDVTQLDELEVKLKESELQIDELQDKYQRLQAEFDNYMKRTQNRFDEVTKVANEGIILKVLEVYDNLERSLAEGFEKDPEAAKKGINAIYRQMMELLKKEGVRPIEALGQPFDPYYQHAVGTIHDKDSPDGIVTEVYQEGYMIREKVLRPAMVVVNRHETAEMDENRLDNEDTGED
ncbi:MAG: nucleotide exchange factor GrpE [Candidatus Thorarchaeota archaeon]